MENITEGLFISAGVIIFIIAMSLTMFLFSQLTTTADVVFDNILQPKYYSEIEITRDDFGDLGSKRIVGKNDIITSLYRYPNQTITITILDSDGKEYQIFDKYIESQVRSLSAKDGLNYIDQALLSKYNDKDNNVEEERRLFLFGVPWIGSTQNHRERVDLFINSEKGYINGKLVDYTNIGLLDIENERFIETVLRYKISGEGLYDNETGTEVITSEIGSYKTEVIYQAIE